MLQYKNVVSFVTRYVPRMHITRLYKGPTADFCFVHMDTRSNAEKALRVLQGRSICGRCIEVTWAIPQQYSKSNRFNMAPETFNKSVPPVKRRILRQYKECIWTNYEGTGSNY